MAIQITTLNGCMTPEQLIYIGHCWHEYCYPFRGVFAAERSTPAIEHKRRVDDFRRALDAFEAESDRFFSEQYVS